MRRLVSILILFFYSISAHSSWDGVATGVIKVIDVVPLGGDNYGFRVALEGSPALCGNTNVWAYINKSDDNYEVSASVLLAAKMSTKEVILYTKQAANGYCHIGYITLK